MDQWDYSMAVCPGDISSIAQAFDKMSKEGWTYDDKFPCIIPPQDIQTMKDGKLVNLGAEGRGTQGYMLIWKRQHQEPANNLLV